MPVGFQVFFISFKFNLYYINKYCKWLSSLYTIFLFLIVIDKKTSLGNPTPYTAGNYYKNTLPKCLAAKHHRPLAVAVEERHFKTTKPCVLPQTLTLTLLLSPSWDTPLLPAI